MNKQSQKYSEQDALEIIELSSESFETLARAFELIAKACADEAATTSDKQPELATVIH